MKAVNKFIKWLLQHKRRKYKFTYIAKGWMGNKYNAGTFEFEVSDNFIEKCNCKDACQFGFFKFNKELRKDFPVIGGMQTYSAVNELI